MPCGAPRPAKSKRRLLLAGGIAAAAIVALVVVLLAATLLGQDGLNIQAAQEGVTRILTDKATGYGLTAVSDVTCNNGENPDIKKGATFTCDVTINEAAQQVTVTFLDDDGKYEVGSPDLPTK